MDLSRRSPSLPADWSALELRVLSSLGGGVTPDGRLCLPSGRSSRQAGKSAGFAALYGSFMDGLVMPDVGPRRTGLRTREWLRWVAGWTRGRTHGHEWLLCDHGALCSRCGFYLAAPSRGRVRKALPQRPERVRRERPRMSCDMGPSELRRATLAFLDALGPCDLVTVSRVMDS